MPSILWSVPVPPAAKQLIDAATPVLHSWDGVLQLASLPLFPPNITMIIMAKQLHFCFIRPVDIFPKTKIIVPMCSSKP